MNVGAYCWRVRALDHGNLTSAFTTHRTLTIQASPVTAEITAADKVYNGTTAATYTCDVVGEAAGDNVTCNGNPGTFANANAGTNKTVSVTGISLGGTDAGNYTLTNTSDTDTADIFKADPNCSIDGFTATYDGDSHGASGSCTGVDDEELSGLDLGETYTDVPGGTANWSFTDETGNYNDDSGSVEIVINKADPTCEINGFTATYDGDSHGASGSCTGVDDEELSGLDLGETARRSPVTGSPSASCGSSLTRRTR
jgi:uncharacterized Zn-binding protein involved in type VI secretion